MEKTPSTAESISAPKFLGSTFKTEDHQSDDEEINLGCESGQNKSVKFLEQFDEIMKDGGDGEVVRKSVSIFVENSEK